MSNETITIVVAVACGLLAIAAYVGLILVPAVTSYSRWWERIGAGFLSLYVLGAFVIAGVGGGAGVVWFWDRFQA
ncbi:MAG: hypothetical protein JWO90_2592 [Solirubrobacterales bacterium]|jgi:hypothetical protein|nr:hypothetical protein [Solirubrobacterales bacterium]